MDLGLEGKNVLITGASSGIGFGIAKAFAAEGANLVLVSRKIELADIKTRLGPMRGSIIVVQEDLAQIGTAERLGAAHLDIDILVNNAGAVPGGGLLEVDEETWRKAWDLKVFGYINMSRIFYASMKQRGGGVIINIAGIGAIIKNSSAICIAAGNAAIVVMSQALGSSSHRDNIRVIAVNPGPVATERFLAVSSSQGQNSLNSAAKLPWARAALVKEIASTVAFLASHQSSYTSGAVVTVDGGLSATAQGL